MKALVFALAVCLTAAFALNFARAADDAAKGDKSPACVPAEKDRVRHDHFLLHKDEALKKGPIDLVFIGDSITDGWRGGEQNKLYNERWGKHNPYNIGISGDQTQHVLWRIQHGELDGIKPKVAVMMIGTNNLGNNNPPHTPADVAAGIKCLVTEIKQRLPETKLLLLGVFPRGKEATDPFRAQIKEVNETIAKLDDGGKTVKYLDIGTQFLAPDGTLPPEIMPDALHPNDKGYQVWADAIGPTIDEMMKG